jgi:nucleoside-diphosphate-sugar epimerase
MRRAAEGAVAVVHLAGRAHVFRETAPDPAAAFHAVNAEAARVVTAAAVAAGSRAFVLMSSIAAVADAGPYGRSKLAAERLAAEAAAPAGMRLVVLRPPMVYGEGMKGNPLRLFRLVDRGLPIPVVRGVHRSVVYAGNLAVAIANILADDAVAGTLDVADETPTVDDFIRHVAVALGRPARTLRVPVAPLRAVAAVGSLISRVVPVPLTTETVNRISTSCVLDTAPLAGLTGVGRLQLFDALGRTAAWYRANGALSHCRSPR